MPAPVQVASNKPHRNSPEPSEPLPPIPHQHAPELSGTLQNLPRPSGTNLSEPSGTYLRNLRQHTPEPSGTFRNPPPEPTPAHAGTLRNLPEPSSGTCSCDPHRHTPELIWTEDPISLRCWGKKNVLREVRCRRPRRQVHGRGKSTHLFIQNGLGERIWLICFWLKKRLVMIVGQKIQICQMADEEELRIVRSQDSFHDFAKRPSSIFLAFLW